MTFDKWFEKQSVLIKVILLIIPVVGWVVEILVRLSALLRKSSTVNILGLVVYVLFGAFIVLEVLDIVWVVLKGQLFLVE